VHVQCTESKIAEDTSSDKLPVLDHFRFRHAPFYYIKVDWKEIKLVMVDFLKINIY